MKIHNMQDDDWKEVSCIYKQGIKDKFTIVKKIPSFEVFKNEHPVCNVAKKNNEIVGFVALGMENYISIYVKNGYKNQGVGTHLMNRLQQDYKILKSKIFIDNAPSLSLHKKMNFNLKAKTKINGDEREVLLYEWVRR
jgi:L-amino acid N-acyltransferase YncA